MSDALRRGGRQLRGDQAAPEPAEAPRADRPAEGRPAQPKAPPAKRRPASQPPFEPQKWNLPDHQRLVSLWAPNSSQGKLIDIVRSQLLYPFHGEPPRTIMVTSAAPGEGKSLLAANLAISFARGLQQYVMVMDCNLMEPRMHELLMVTRRPGLTDYLEGRVGVPEIIHWTQVERLSVTPAGSPSGLSSELLATDRMAGLVQELRDRYSDRYILLDTPPVQAFDDPAVLARKVEGIVVVVQSGATDREEVLRALGRLPEEKLMGLVLNDQLSTVVDASNVSMPGEREPED
jgi:capsular exopolysaccharide synthesis family protein